VATTAVSTRRRTQVPLGKRLLGALADDKLVEHVRAGDERAFEVVYDRYHRGLLAFCRHMLGSADEAEDALQQTFVSAHADLLRSKRPIRLKPWLYTIARNRCLSLLRARREQASELVEPATIGLSDEVETRMELRALLADMERLPEQQRAAIVLAEVGDLSHAEIGEIIGCEAIKVRALIFQARSALIDARGAREIPCAEIREQLATATGGALRRAELRRHLRVCAGCAEYREEVRRQKAMLAVVLPVLPSVALKRSVLAAAGIGSGGAGAGGAGIVAGVAAKGGLAKLITIGAIGTAAVGGGVALEESGTLSTGGHEQVPPAAAPTPERAIATPGIQSLSGPKPQNAPAQLPHQLSSHSRAPAAQHHKHPTPHTRHPTPANKHQSHAKGPPATVPNNGNGITHRQAKGDNGNANANGHAKVPTAKPPTSKPVPPKSQAPLSVPPIPAPGGQDPVPTPPPHAQGAPPLLHP
jgi:RNA polymerase sigma factor (sigma-70 family)